MTNAVDESKTLPPGNDATGAQKLQEALARAVRDMFEVRLRRYEGGSLTDARSHCLRTIREGVSRSIEILGSVLELYRATKGMSPCAEETLEVASHAAGGSPGEGDDRHRSMNFALDARLRVTDLALMARRELRSQLEDLEEISAEARVWTIVAKCGGVRRKSTKSLTAVETSIAAFEGNATLLGAHYMTELQRAIETRRLYARLRQDLRRLPSFEQAGMANLRAAGVAIAILIGQDIYEELRISDRIQIRGIQERILEHLREDLAHGSNLRSSEAARRAFQDLISSTDWFLQVNHDPILVEHDAVLIDEALLELEGFPAQAELPREWLESFRSLFGRDEAVDALFQTRSRNSADWSKALERARTHLTRDIT